MRLPPPGARIAGPADIPRQARLMDALNRAGLHVPLLKIALAEGFVHHGAVNELRAQQRIDEPGILAQIREALGVVGERSAGAAPRRTRSRISAA